MAAMISSRGRYALRVMSELAEQGSEQAVPLKEIAAREALSQKYLEAIKAAMKDYYDRHGIAYDESMFPAEHDCESCEV